MAINYAKEYATELANSYPYTLYSGALWNTENRAKYRVINAKTVEIPVVEVGGRKDGSTSTIGGFTQNFSNTWETKTLSNHRVWETLAHPRDIQQTKGVTAIATLTKVMNEEEKFPEMDAYTFSNIYKLRNALEEITPILEDLTVTTVLDQFDTMMNKMDEARVPATGRILYCDTFTKTLIKKAIAITRSNGQKTVSRDIERLDEVEIIPVPTDLLKTSYDFTKGYVASVGAKDIKMLLIHPSSVLPIVEYEFAQLGEPSALSQGKYVYFEESFEDIFILNKRKEAIQIVVK